MSEKPCAIFDEALERWLIGAILLDPLQLPDVESIQPEAFYNPSHQAIWRALLSLRPESISVSTVKARLGPEGTPAVREALRVAEEGALSAAGAAELAGKLRELSIRRRAQALASKLAELAADRQATPASLIEQAERLGFELADGASSDADMVPFGSVALEAIALAQRIRDAGAVTGVTTSLPILDRRTSGMRPGQLWILAARPGIGKTSLAMQMVLAAARAGTPAGMFSLEMPRVELALRAICSEAGIDQADVKHGRCSAADYNRLCVAAGNLHVPAWVDDTARCTVADIRTKARRLKRRHPELALLVVDYLQLCQGSARNGENREQVIAGISRGLKLLAKELQIPVLALSQFSREVEKEKRRPRLSDLRESGSLEQDCDVAIFIHREGDAQPVGDGEVYECEMIIAKQRNGPIGTMPIWFESRRTRFTDRPPLAPDTPQTSLPGVDDDDEEQPPHPAEVA